MLERMVVLDGSEETERAIPHVAGVEVTEKDVAEAASSLAAVGTASAKSKVKSQAYPIDERTDIMEEAMVECQRNFFC
jgi:hypothetical protein